MQAQVAYHKNYKTNRPSEFFDSEKDQLKTRNELFFVVFFLNWRIIILLCWFLLYESAICIHISLPLEPPSHPTPPGHHRAPNWAPCVNSSFPLAVCFTCGAVHMSALLSLFIQPSPPLSLTSGLFCTSASIPTLQFISTIFLDSMYMQAILNRSFK